MLALEMATLLLGPLSFFPHLALSLLVLQLGLKQTRWAKVLGSSIGVTIGCVLGMTPLLFLDTREDRAKKEETAAAASDIQVA